MDIETSKIERIILIGTIIQMFYILLVPLLDLSEDSDQAKTLFLIGLVIIGSFNAFLVIRKYMKK
jgi:hypothetical protein